MNQNKDAHQESSKSPWLIVVLSVLFLVVTAGLIFAITTGLQPKPIKKIKPTPIESLDQAGALIFRRLFQEIKQSPSLVLAESSLPERAIPVWQGIYSLFAKYDMRLVSLYSDQLNQNESAQIKIDAITQGLKTQQNIIPLPHNIHDWPAPTHQELNSEGHSIFVASAPRSWAYYNRLIERAKKKNLDFKTVFIFLHPLGKVEENRKKCSSEKSNERPENKQKTSPHKATNIEKNKISTLDEKGENIVNKANQTIENKLNCAALRANQIYRKKIDKSKQQIILEQHGQGLYFGFLSTPKSI